MKHFGACCYRKIIKPIPCVYSPGWLFSQNSMFPKGLLKIMRYFIVYIYSYLYYTITYTYIFIVTYLEILYLWLPISVVKWHPRKTKCFWGNKKEKKISICVAKKPQSVLKAVLAWNLLTLETPSRNIQLHQRWHRGRIKILIGYEIKT